MGTCALIGEAPTGGGSGERRAEAAAPRRPDVPADPRGSLRADPAGAVASVKTRDPLINDKIEQDRIKMTLDYAIITPNVLDHGYSNVDMARLEGILGAPEGGAGLASIVKLVEAGKIGREETVVLFNTGSGYKYIEAWQTVV